MIDYQNENELIHSLYLKFFDVMRNRGINPNTGSGAKILPLIDARVTAMIADGDIPQNSQFLYTIPGSGEKLQEAEDNLVTLANSMADNAISLSYTELHELTLSNIKKTLCPLFPWLREPCSQYDSLIEP